MSKPHFSNRATAEDCAAFQGEVLFTTKEAAGALGVSLRTIQLWVEAGTLPAGKTPGGHRRIPQTAIRQLRENQLLAGSNKKKLIEEFERAYAENFVVSPSTFTTLPSGTYYSMDVQKAYRIFCAGIKASVHENVVNEQKAREAALRPTPFNI